MNKINDILKYREDGLSYNEIAKKIEEVINATVN